MLPNITVIRRGKENGAAAEFGKDWGQSKALPSTPEPQTLPPGHNPEFTVMYKMPSLKQTKIKSYLQYLS